MQIFLTGSTGFIGSHFLRLALEEGHQVKALRRPGSEPRIPLEVQPQWIEASLSEVSSKEFSQVDVIVHSAAYGITDLSNWEECFKVNLHESLALFRKAIETGISSFVVIGSCFEYGKSGERYDSVPPTAASEPTCAYGASKACFSSAALALAYQYDLKMQILRLFHVFGEGEAEERFWPSLRIAARAGADFPMTTGEQVRDFAPVQEVARQLLEAITDPDLAPTPGKPTVRNLGSGKPQSLLDFAEFWWRQWNAKGELRVGALPQRSAEVMRYVPEV